MKAKGRGQFKRALWLRPTCNDASDTYADGAKAEKDFQKDHLAMDTAEMSNYGSIVIDHDMPMSPDKLAEADELGDTYHPDEDEDPDA
jgi:hypothetical protein